MKKTLLSTLRVICAGAMSLYAVSCYDDSALREDLAGLEDEVAGLAARLDSLESKLNSEVKTLGGLIEGLEASTALKDQELAAAVADLTAKLDALDGKLDGYITSNDDAIAAAIAEFQKTNETLAAADADLLAKLVAVGVTNVAKNEAGNVVITFVTGDTLEIPTTPQEGLVTVVEEDGVKYWAVVVNGEPVSLEVPVGHPGLEFKVEDNELLFTVDGTTWTATGAVVADDQMYFLSDFYQGAEWDDDLWEEVADDYYTFVFGGVEYKLPLYKVDNSVVTIKAGKTYFAYGQEVTVDVAVADVTAMYVMTKPDGWKASLDGKKLTVVAPAEAAITAGYAEADGEVLLHCTTTEGNCKIARLAVATTAGFNITVEEDGNVTIVNPLVDLDNYDFVDAYVGIVDVSKFEADPVSYVAGVSNNYDDVIFMINTWKQNTMDWETYEYTIGGMYSPGEYDVDVIESTVEEMYLMMKYVHGNDAIPAGSRFVVWACPVDSKTGEPITSELVFAYYSTPVEVSLESTKVSFTDVEVSVEVAGATTYYVGMVTEEMTYGFPIDDYMLNQQGPFGYFQSAVAYGYEDWAFQYMGTLYENPGEAITVTASELNYGQPLLPNTKFYMWVFPVIEGLALADYTYEENLQPYIYEFTTSGLEAGGTLTATFGEPTTTFTNINVPVSAEGAALVYYNFYDVEEFNAIDDAAADLLESGYVSSASNFTAVANNLTPGTDRKLAVVVVDENGLYGEVVTETYSSAVITYSETFKATVGEITIEEGSYYSMVTIPVTVEGGEAAKYYWYFGGEEKTEEWLKENLPLGKYPCSYGKVLSAQYAYFNSFDSYQFAVVVESTEGEFSEPVIVTVNKPVSEEGDAPADPAE